MLARHVRGAAQLTPITFTPTDDPALAPFEGVHDVAGDGTLLLLPTPGHSPGSMSLLIHRADAPPLLLVGDVTYDPALVPHGIVPDVGDRPTQLTTAHHIHHLQNHYPTLILLAAHDPNATLRLAAR